MPKKRNPTYNTRPNTPTHPSLSSSTTKHRDDPRSLGTSAASTGNSVNDRIQELRLSQRSSPTSASRSSSGVLNPGANPSLPPSLRSILQIPDAPPPRPRPNLRVLGRLRNPAGPAAPASWLKRNEDRGRGRRVKDSAHRDGVALQVQSLPGSFLPEDGSLMAITLTEIAKNWEWHKVYDQYYLPTIPVRYKEALLHYIAQYSDHGTDKAGLDLLFQNDSDLDDATGAEGLTHLDLATSIGHPLKFSDLKQLLAKHEVPSAPKSTSDPTPESWDDSASPQPGPSNLANFDTLTHLSLAHPHTTATWKNLLDLAPHLTTLTHLSLSHWSVPTLSPNSKTAYTETPHGDVDYGGSNFYSALEQDWSEAVSILRRLSKHTYCLQHLDLTGCHPWIQSLADPKIGWLESWRALVTVNVTQSWIPECFQPEAGESDWRSVWVGGRGKAASQQLLDWIDVEYVSLLTEDAVNTIIAGPRRRTASIESARQETMQEQTESIIPSFDEHPRQRGVVDISKDRRIERVRFERGWDEWWIKDAVMFIKLR